MIIKIGIKYQSFDFFIHICYFSDCGTAHAMLSFDLLINFHDFYV